MASKAVAFGDSALISLRHRETALSSNRKVVVENLVVVGALICLDLDSSWAVMEAEVTVGRISSAGGLKKGGWMMHALR